MTRASKYSPEVQERAAQHTSQWAAIKSIAAEIGCTAETLRRWVRQGERDAVDEDPADQTIDTHISVWQSQFSLSWRFDD